MNNLNKLVSKELVGGLPKLKFVNDGLCNACQKGKQARSSFKSQKCYFYLQTTWTSTSRSFWSFLSSKSRAFKSFQKLAKLVQNGKDFKVKSLRSGPEGLFQMTTLSCFVNKMALIITFMLKEHNKK